MSEAFGSNPSLEVRSDFLDISKVFEKVWHEALLYKLRSVGISGELYNRFGNYQVYSKGFFYKEKCVVKTSFSRCSQGSMLGPLLLLCLH